MLTLLSFLLGRERPRRPAPSRCCRLGDLDDHLLRDIGLRADRTSSAVPVQQPLPRDAAPRRHDAGPPVRSPVSVKRVRCRTSSPARRS